MLALALALAGCGAGARCVVPEQPAGASASAWLWHVQAASGVGPVVWLYGTIHNGGAADVPVPAWAALDGAAVLVSELGDLEPDPEALREEIRLPRGKGLDQLLPTDDWWTLRDALRGAIREDDLKRVRPWYAMSLLTRTLAPSPDPTMDVALARRARARGIAVDHLETWEEQLPQLDAAVGVPDLIEAIDARATMRCDLARTRAAYGAGDHDAMLGVFGFDRSGLLLRPRTERWLPRIEAYVAARGAFVAVGIGHLLGDAGLPARLARAGYRVRRVAPR